MNSKELTRIRKMLHPDVPPKVKAEILAKLQKEATRYSLDMQQLLKELIFTKSKRVPYEGVDIFGTGLFWCLDCGDKYSLKSTYDLHVNRCSIKISHFCRICRRKCVFTNKCMMLAHVRGHTNSTLSFNLSGTVVEALPPELMPLGSIDNEYDNAMISNMTLEELKAASLRIADMKNSTTNIESQNDNTGADIQPDRSNKTSQLLNEDIENEISSSVVEKMNSTTNLVLTQTNNESIMQQNCFICMEKFTLSPTVAVKDLMMMHYKRIQRFAKVYSCSNCKLQMPNRCAQIAHNNVHTSKPPYVCPECGLVLFNLETFGLHLASICFHFSRAQDIECQISNCFTSHSIELLPDHFMKNHTKQLFRCNTCSINFTSIYDLRSHSLRVHKVEKIINYTTDAVYQCKLCGNAKTFHSSDLKRHMTEHDGFMRAKISYRCIGCKFSIQSFQPFQQHISKCAKYQYSSRTLISSYSFYSDLLLSSHSQSVPSEKSIYPSSKQLNRRSHHKSLRKTCDACRKSFVYLYSKCDESKLPARCPLCGSASEFKTSTKIFIQSTVSSTQLLSNGQLEEKDIANNISDTTMSSMELQSADSFTLVDDQMSNDEDNDTIYINSFVPLATGSIKKNKRKIMRNKRKRSEDLVTDVTLSNSDFAVSQVSNPGEYVCAVCSFKSYDKKIFHEHIATHKSVSTAYQCMECGLSFTVRPSFATHLLTAHGICNIEEYLQKNNCVDVQAIAKLGSDMSAHPANENQCSICYEQFENKIEHDKHFRIHGMAFLANTKQMTTQKSTQ